MSYVNLNYHLIAATKERRAFITDEIRDRLVQYIGGIIRNLGGTLIEANGPQDHLHMAAILNARHTIADVMREIKAHSSCWVHETFPSLRVFGWQDGYAAFSVSHSQLPAVVEYIRRQLEHHHKMTFEEELTKLLLALRAERRGLLALRAERRGPPVLRACRPRRGQSA